MSYIFSHTMLGFCWWDVPAAIILIAVIVTFIVKSRKMKQQKEELEGQIAEIEAARVPITPEEG